MPHTHRVAPGASIDLSKAPTRADGFHDDKNAARHEFRELREELVEWQRRLYAHGQHKLLIVFQAMDAGGKDGTTKKIMRGVNPQGVRVESFKVPSTRERAHDFLWRIHRVVPPAGYITVFNRSHYEDILVPRVHKLVPEEVWQARYRMINDFEAILAGTGTHILKFFLHISPEEQRRRFHERVHNPLKQWKFSVQDIEKARDWNDYMAAYEGVLAECSTAAAPWHVIPADQKWYRNLAVIRVILDRLRTINPEYPPHGYDPEEIDF